MRFKVMTLIVQVSESARVVGARAEAKSSAGLPLGRLGGARVNSPPRMFVVNYSFPCVLLAGNREPSR